MPLVHMTDMLRHAHANRYAVPAFDLVSLEFLEGIMAACERKRAPVILSLAESHFEYFDFELVMPAVVKAARRASVPVAIHLDHGESLDSVVRGINLGCTSVMIDASHHPFEENVRLTKEVVDVAHACGVPVEGELGYVPGVEGEDAEKHPGEVRYTTPEEAKRFVEETGVDFLAVSIGTVHGRMKGEPQLDFERLAEINEALGIPLVIHGGTGLSEEQYRRLIENGVTKINYYTALSDAAAAVMRENAANSQAKGYTAIVKGAREAIAAECERMIALWGAENRADALLEVCRPWREVAHVIEFNVEGISEEEAAALKAEGRKVLAQIPGVLAVETGTAIQPPDAAYRHCWLVRFCQPQVIDYYRDHPEHVRYADERFRPVAGNRITIDFQLDE